MKVLQIPSRYGFESPARRPIRIQGLPKDTFKLSPPADEEQQKMLALAKKSKARVPKGNVVASESARAQRQDFEKEAAAIEDRIEKEEETFSNKLSLHAATPEQRRKRDIFEARVDLLQLRQNSGRWEDQDKRKNRGLTTYRKHADVIQPKDIEALKYSEKHSSFKNRYRKEWRETLHAIAESNNPNPKIRLQALELSKKEFSQPTLDHKDWSQLIDGTALTEDDELKRMLRRNLPKGEKHLLPQRPDTAEHKEFQSKYKQFGGLLNAKLAARIKGAKGGVLSEVRELSELRGYTRDLDSNIYGLEKREQVEAKLTKAIASKEFAKTLETARAKAAREAFGERLPAIVGDKKKWLESKEFQKTFDLLPSKEAGEFLEKELGELAALDPEAASSVSNSLASRLMERHKDVLMAHFPEDAKKYPNLKPAAQLAKFVSKRAGKGSGPLNVALRALRYPGRLLGAYSNISGIAHDVSAGDVAGVVGKGLQVAGGSGLLLKGLGKAIPGLNVVSWLATGAGLVIDLFSEDRDQELARKHGIR
jgi:hypothetical protein